MPWFLLLLAPAVAGELLIEARVPAEVHLDGRPVAQLFHPAEVRVEASPGTLPVTVFTHGSPQRLEIEIPEEGTAVLVVGRTGLSTGPPRPPDETAPVLPVEIRGVGGEEVMVVVGRERHAIRPGQALSLELATGEHSLSLRNADGTLIWASGTLHLGGSEPVLVQVSDGQMPEIARGRARFTPETP